MDGYMLGGNPSLFSNSAGKALTLRFDRGWYGSEGNRSFYWSWARGNATHEIRNPHASAVSVRFRFSLVSIGRRTVRLKLNGEEIWSTKLGEHQVLTAALSSIRLQPGRSELVWETDEPAVLLTNDPRELAFMVQNFRMDVVRLLPDEPAR